MWTKHRSGISLVGFFHLIALSSRVFGDTQATSIATEPEKLCYWGGGAIGIKVGQNITLNCNDCICLSFGTSVKLYCETNECLIDDHLAVTVKRHSDELGWDSEIYEGLWGKTLVDGHQLKLAAPSPLHDPKMHLVNKYSDSFSLPREFDARTHWPGFISEIRDRGCWLFPLVDVLNDRFAIHSKGVEKPKLSVQHLLSCYNVSQDGCKSGNIHQAWIDLHDYGLVNEECYPSVGNKETCKFQKHPTTLREANCNVPPNEKRTTLYKIKGAYRIKGEDDIRKEILDAGPVLAHMYVHHDFFIYKSGIYRHSFITEPHKRAWHTVRIIGWGEKQLDNCTPSVKYWIVANSWGVNWGENGYAKIIRRKNEGFIEDNAYGVWVNATV